MMAILARVLSLINLAARLIKGFTLIELIMVIVIISILSATFIPKITGPSIFYQRQLIDQFIADLHQAKLRAQQNFCPIQLTVLKQSYQFIASKQCATIDPWDTDFLPRDKSAMNLEFSVPFKMILQPEGHITYQNNKAFYQHFLIVRSGQSQTELLFYGATGFIRIKE